MRDFLLKCTFKFALKLHSLKIKLPMFTRVHESFLYWREKIIVQNAKKRFLVKFWKHFTINHTPEHKIDGKRYTAGWMHLQSNIIEHLMVQFGLLGKNVAAVRILRLQPSDKKSGRKSLNFCKRLVFAAENVNLYDEFAWWCEVQSPMRSLPTTGWYHFSLRHHRRVVIMIEVLMLQRIGRARGRFHFPTHHLDANLLFCALRQR